MPVVVGFAPTREGRAALHRGAREALRRRTDLVVVAASRRPQGPESDDFSAQIDAVRAELGAQGLHVQQPEPARDGDMADEIISVSEAMDAELIVIGLRRRTPVGKLLLGSNAQRILLDSRSPVLAVKADERQVER